MREIKTVRIYGSELYNLVEKRTELNPELVNYICNHVSTAKAKLLQSNHSLIISLWQLCAESIGCMIQDIQTVKRYEEDIVWFDVQYLV